VEAAKPVPTHVSQRALTTLLAASPERGEPVADAWFRLTRRLDAEDAAALPHALGLLARLLEADPERLRLLVDIAVVHDLFEVADHLLDLTFSLEDPHVLLGLASLASHPGVPSAIARRTADLEHRLPEGLREPFRLRLDPSIPTTSDLSARLRLQRWPGVRPWPGKSDLDAPLVAVAESGLPPDLVFHLLGCLRRHGAIVRRIPASFARRPDPAWLARWVPILSVSGRGVATLRRAGLPVTSAQLVVVDDTVVRTRDAARLLAAVDDHLWRNALPRLLPRPTGGPTRLDSEPLDVDVFTLGAYDRREVAFLSGCSPRTVDTWRRQLAILEPHRVEGFPYWRFNQLVALRTYFFLRARLRRRIPLTIVEQLAEFAGRDRPIDLGVTEYGIVPLADGSPSFELRTGQGVMPEVVRLEETFQAFTIGGGYVPGLLAPSDYTRVHPAVMGGTPTVEGSRLACKTLALLRKDHPVEVLLGSYPSLSPEQLSDALQVGNEILG
jgi:uncharacterized protein (DUF433 family)